MITLFVLWKYKIKKTFSLSIDTQTTHDMLTFNIHTKYIVIIPNKLETLMRRLSKTSFFVYCQDVLNIIIKLQF